MSAGGKVFVYYQGEMVCLRDKAKEKGRNYGTVYTRWQKLGKPQCVDDSLFGFPQRHRVSGGYWIDGVHYTSYQKIAYAIKKSESWVNDHMQVLKKRHLTMEELMTSQPRRRPYKPKEAKKARPSANREKPAVEKGIPSNSRQVREMYADPHFLPHIPLGDLAHLSNTRNTGAGRGDLDEAPVCCRTVSPLSVAYVGTKGAAHAATIGLV